MAHVRRSKVPGKSDEGTGASDAKKRRRVLSDSDDDDERDKRTSAAAASGLPPLPSTPVGASKFGELLGGSTGLRHQGLSGGPVVAASSEKHKPAELFRKDLISAMKMPDSEPLLPEEYIVICDPWRQDWEKGVQVPVNSEFILEPKVTVISEPEKTGTFKMPRKLIHVAEDQAYSPGTHDLSDMAAQAEKACRYDLDDLDVAWLECYNYQRHQMGQEPVPEYVVEKVMEELETQCHDNMEEIIRNSEGLGIEYDENVVCDVCRSPESEENNEMVFCDGCNVCVHQACYGVHKIPDGTWLCRTCALGIKPPCALCPKAGGAMKATKSGRTWAHVSCALWIPEVSIGDAEKMEPVTKISHIPTSRWNLLCSLCREKMGACIQCDVRTCKTAFHVTCAFEHKLEMKTIVDESSVGGDVKLKAFCQKHSGEHRASGASDGELSTSSPLKSRSGGSPTKKDLTDAERAGARAQKIAELNNSFYTCVKPADVAAKLRQDPVGILGGSVFDTVSRGCFGSTVEELVDFIYQYWKVKRRSWFNTALLTPKTEEADFLTRQQEDSLIARMKMFVHLRQDLEKVRNLCYMISRREKRRKAFYKIREEVFFKQVDCLLQLGDQPLLASADRSVAAAVQDVVSANHSDSIYDNPARWEPRDVAEEPSPAVSVNSVTPSASGTTSSISAVATDRANRATAADRSAFAALAVAAKSVPSGAGTTTDRTASTGGAASVRGTRPFASTVVATSAPGRVGGKDRGKDSAAVKSSVSPRQPRPFPNGLGVATQLPLPLSGRSSAGGTASKYKIDQTLRDVVHGRIFHTRRPKPYVNGVYDRTQRRLDSYFQKAERTASDVAGRRPGEQGLPRVMNSPETRSVRRRIETEGDGAASAASGNAVDKLFESVDSEVSINVSALRPSESQCRPASRAVGQHSPLAGGDLDKENNIRVRGGAGACASTLANGVDEDEGSEVDPDGEMIADDLMYPVVSETFPKRVTRSRITESLAKVWHAVTGVVYRN